MAEPVLTVSKLDAFYGDIHVLRDVSLSAQPGEVLCILGRNGAGKSTLMKSIMGLMPKITGTIQMQDRNLLDLPVPAADRDLQLHRECLRGGRPARHDRQRAPGALVDRDGRHLDVDALRDADLPRGFAFHSRLHLRGGGGPPGVEVAPVLVDHRPHGPALPHAGGAVSGYRELQNVRSSGATDRRRAWLHDRADLDQPQA